MLIFILFWFFLLIEFHFILWSRQLLSVQQKYFTQFYSICLVVFFQLEFWLKCVIKHFHQHKYRKEIEFLWKYCFSCIESTTIVYNFSNHFTSSSYNPYEIYSIVDILYIFMLYIFFSYYLLFATQLIHSRNEIDLNINLTNKKFGSIFQLNFIYQNKFQTQINRCF